MNDDFNIKTKDWDNYYVLVDFDRTLTDGSSLSSWEILSKSGFMPQEYVDKVNKLYNYYRPLEIDLDIDFDLKNNLMEEWWSKNINLFSEYNLREEYIKEVVKKNNFIYFRNGADKFLEVMHEKEVPVVIMSAGVGNVIVEFLKYNNCLYDNILVISNFINFNNGNDLYVNKDIIHSLNKNESFIPDDLHNIDCVVMGDVVDDVLMVDDDRRSSALKIGFLNKETKNYKSEFLKVFDIVMEDDQDFYDLMNILDIFKDNKSLKNKSLVLNR